MKELSKLLHFVEIWQRKWCSSSFCYCHTTTFVVSYSCYATTATSIAFFKCTWMCDVLKRAKIPRLVSVLYTVMKIWFFVGKFWLYLNTASKENEKKVYLNFHAKNAKKSKVIHWINPSQYRAHCIKSHIFSPKIEFWRKLANDLIWILAPKFKNVLEF